MKSDPSSQPDSPKESTPSSDQPTSRIPLFSLSTPRKEPGETPQEYAKRVMQALRQAQAPGGSQDPSAKSPKLTGEARQRQMVEQMKQHSGASRRERESEN